MFVGRISALMNPVTYIIVNLSIAAIVWEGGIRVNSGIITPVSYTHLDVYKRQIFSHAMYKLNNRLIMPALSISPYTGKNIVSAV